MAATHRHIHWIDSTGNPCLARIVRDLGAGQVLVEFSTLPPRVIMPKRQALPMSALRAL